MISFSSVFSISLPLVLNKSAFVHFGHNTFKTFLNLNRIITDFVIFDIVYCMMLLFKFLNSKQHCLYDRPDIFQQQQIVFSFQKHSLHMYNDYRYPILYSPMSSKNNERKDYRNHHHQHHCCCFNFLSFLWCSSSKAICGNL